MYLIDYEQILLSERPALELVDNHSSLAWPEKPLSDV
jgi:hypothetical protein